MSWLVGSEVLTALIMKKYIFLDITPCSPLKVDIDLERTTRPYSPEDRVRALHVVTCLRQLVQSNTSLSMRRTLSRQPERKKKSPACSTRLHV
jgi:hypothetical protein